MGFVGKSWATAETGGISTHMPLNSVHKIRMKTSRCGLLQPVHDGAGPFAVNPMA
jgi:hypothetical protein